MYTNNGCIKESTRVSIVYQLTGFVSCALLPIVLHPIPANLNESLAT